MYSFKSLGIDYLWKGCTDGEEVQERLLKNWLHFFLFKNKCTF